MTKSSGLLWFGVRSQPFSKEINDDDLWLLSSKPELIDELADAIRARASVVCHNATLGRGAFHRQLCTDLGLTRSAAAAAVLSAVSSHVEKLGRERHALSGLLQDYPEPATNVMLNLLGSHDTPRPLTVVAKHNGGANAHAFESLKLMVTMQFTWAGAACIFYGDEVGMEGEMDPDCRRCYPWNWEREDHADGKRAELLAYYKKIIAIRKDNPALRHGRFRKLQADSQFYAFERRIHDNHCVVAINQSNHEHTVQLPGLIATDLLGGLTIENQQILIPAHCAAIVRITTPPTVASAILEDLADSVLIDTDVMDF